jgi:hypothetical protein
MQRRRAKHTGSVGLWALAAILLCVLVGVGALYAPRPSFLSGRTGGSNFAWLSAALSACEKNAASQPQTLTFMVVPLAPTQTLNDSLSARAIEKIGAATLFDSKAAIEGLEGGAFRISSEQFVLYALDTSNNVPHRWNSAVGISTLTTRDGVTGGPYKIRLQTVPDEPVAWSTSTAGGIGTCHWIFALFRR